MDGQGPGSYHTLFGPKVGPVDLRPSATGPGIGRDGGLPWGDSKGNAAMPVSSQTKRISTWRTHVLLFYTTNLLGCFNLRSTQTQKTKSIQRTQNTQTNTANIGHKIVLPIGSMYAIYGNIYHQYTPNVSIYTSTMDPMG